MKSSGAAILAIVVLVLVFASFYTSTVQSQSSATETRSRFDNKTRRERFTSSGSIQAEQNSATGAPKVTEAPTGFDNQTNGFTDQGPAFDTINEDNVVPLRSFNDNRFIFEEAEGIADGLGPTYNAQGCRECHQNVVTGGASQIAEHRTGQTSAGEPFFPSQGGSLIQSRATHPDIVERVYVEDNLETFRISTNTLGNGFVECIANSTLLAIRDKQPAAQRGTAVMVPVLEANNQGRLGRFGWKNQHASLESFSADAYLNEMGITTPLLPDENLSGGVDVSRASKFGPLYDPVAEPEDDGVDVTAFANFMRSTKAPSRGPIKAGVTEGDKLFTQIGCATCHVPSITTAPPGTRINGGKFTVPPALGNKIIHPYSDFLLHDIGTSDGIPIQPSPEFASTANKMRTAPLWALRTRNRLMHDGKTFTKQAAILRHAGQATSAKNAYNALSTAQQNQLLAFLDSL